MVSPKDLRNTDETADVADKLCKEYRELAARTKGETNARAIQTADAASALAAQARGLKEHIEKNEDIA